MNGLARCGHLALAASLALGCANTPGGGGAAGGAGGPTSGASGMALGGAAGASVSGSSNGGTASGAGGSAAFEPLVPLVTGHESTFEQAAIDPIAQRNDCVPLTAKMGEGATIAGKQGVLYQAPCSTDAQYLLVGSGDQISVYPVMAGALGTGDEYIHSPVTEGESWGFNTIVFTWHAVTEPVETKAGTFDHDCWVRDATDEGLRYTYCRGAGLVKLYDREVNYEVTLVSKNF
jgi:hypothetical protein